MKTVKVLPAALIILLFTASAFAAGTTRITFSHVEATSWGDTRETEGYIVEWNMTTTTTVSFPVDVDAYNNGTINPPSTDQVCFKLSTPEYEGTVNITVSGHINITTKGIIPITGYTEFQNTTSIPASTPLGEWNISYPIPVSIGVGVSITVTVIPTFYVNASVTANVALTGPAIAFTPLLTWETDGAIENVTVIPVDAELGDEIVVSAHNFTYSWNASLTVELKLEGIHLITSPPYWFETPSLQADGEATVSFNIQVIPEFPHVAAVAMLCLAETALLLHLKKKLKPSPLLF
ncbi:hypothetical protein MUP77_03260 [Candidatus Bathyarchaeota archaeon]|nr:hypothetical protein [Candidatus Bathyarchaeota archaeon]